MSILKYKYKAHKLINTLFYVVVFGIGFVLGFGTNKIDFNKLVSQVLMIDYVSALDIGTVGDYKITDEFIYNKFYEYQDNFLEEYPYLVCEYSSSQLTCNAYSEEYFNTLYVKSTEYSNRYGIGTTGGDNYKLYFTIMKSGYTSGPKKVPNNGPGSSSLMEMQFYRDSTTTTMYSNFDPKLITGPDSTYPKPFINLDFIKLEFNENLFKDNPDFKEVCVDKTDKFLITPVDYGENNKISTTDFIWFPHKISGFYGSAIDNDNLIGENVADEYRYYFNSKEAINEEFNEDGLQYLLTIVSYYSYENRYSYYGWSAHPFDIFYNQNNDNYYRFPYFYFENPEMYKLDGSKIVNDESLPFDDYLSYNNEKICFYIRNKFNVEIINKDLNDNDYIDITLPGGSVHINKDNSNFSSGLFTSITKFINEVSDCLDLIKDNIYNFYLSMPYLLRLFIVSTFTVLIVKFIIGMVVK